MPLQKHTELITLSLRNTGKVKLHVPIAVFGNAEILVLQRRNILAVPAEHHHLPGIRMIVCGYDVRRSRTAPVPSDQKTQRP